MNKPDILIVLANLSYRLHHNGRQYDFDVVQRAMEEIIELRKQSEDHSNGR